MELDNPFWHAIIGPHRAIAPGDGLARRYPAQVNADAALEGPTPRALADLAVGRFFGVWEGDRLVAMTGERAP